VVLEYGGHRSNYFQQGSRRSISQRVQREHLEVICGWFEGAMHPCRDEGNSLLEEEGTGADLLVHKTCPVRICVCCRDRTASQNRYIKWRNLRTHHDTCSHQWGSHRANDSPRPGYQFRHDYRTRLKTPTLGTARHDPFDLAAAASRATGCTRIIGPFGAAATQL
jgi:hypothetical protein